MRRLKPRTTISPSLLAALTLLACTEIPAPAGLDAALPDAGADASPAETCLLPVQRGEARSLIVFAHGDAATDRGVAWTFLPLTGFREPEGDPAEEWQLEVALVGDLAALEGGSVVDLSGESSLASCNHCVVVWRECDGVPSDCVGDPWVPVSGEAYVVRAPEIGAPAPGELSDDAFEVVLRDVVLVPARVGPTLDTTPDPARGCVRLPYFRAAGRVEENDCTFSRIACELEAQSGAR